MFVVDPVITPEIFAQSIVDDYGLAPAYLAILTKAIQDQLSDYKAHSAILLDEGEINGVPEDDIIKGTLEGEDSDWWASWKMTVRSPTFAKLVQDDKETAHSRKRRKVVKDEVAEAQVLPSPALKDQPMSLEEFEEDESLTLEEMRILIKVGYSRVFLTRWCSCLHDCSLKLDIIVGTFHLEDQIEWDIDSQDPAPEQFAEVYAKDLGLGGEFKCVFYFTVVTSISFAHHCIGPPSRTLFENKYRPIKNLSSWLVTHRMGPQSRTTICACRCYRRFLRELALWIKSSHSLPCSTT